MWRPPPVIRMALAAELGVIFHKRKIHQIGVEAMQSDVDELYGVLVGRLEIKTGGQWRSAPPHAFALYERRSIYGIRPEPGYTGPVEIINILFRRPAGWVSPLKHPHLQLPDVWWRKFLDLEAGCHYDAAGQRVVATASLIDFVETLGGSRVALTAVPPTVEIAASPTGHRAAKPAAATPKTIALAAAAPGLADPVSAAAIAHNSAATRTVSALSPRRPDVQVEWMETWAQAEDVIRRRAGEGLTAAELARAVDVSPTQLRRIYHAVRGISPKAALTEFRIGQAKKLLSSGDVSVTQVADRVGYDTIQRFSAAFRAATGKTPTAYARSS